MSEILPTYVAYTTVLFRRKTREYGTVICKVQNTWPSNRSTGWTHTHDAHRWTDLLP